MPAARVLDAPTTTDRLQEAYSRHFPAAVRFAYLLTGDRETAEDLAQDAFVRLAGRFAHLRHPDAFPAYLRRTIVNLHTSKLRRRRLERDWLQRARPPAPDALPDIAVQRDVWEAMRDLPPRQRAAVALRYYADLSERDAAHELGCSLTALKSLVTRALQTLRTRLEGDEP